MEAIMLTAAVLAGGVHFLFFLMESVWWMQPKIYKTFRMQDDNEARLTRPLALNQGFYNLFLTMGIAIGLALIGSGHAKIGYGIITYVCLFMLGAALVLLVSSPKMIRGVLLQGVLPFIYTALFLMKYFWKG
jgi:putative membrane protein